MIEEKPKTVKKLSERTAELSKTDRITVYNIIREMENEGEIHLGSVKIERKFPSTFSQYFLQVNYYSVEFWILISLSILFFLTVLLISKDSPFYFLRVIMGIIYGLIVPGWAISIVIFPKLYEIIDQIERTLIAIGINIGTIVFGGLILNQIWSLDNKAFVITLGSVTIVATILSATIRIMMGSGKLSLENLKIKKMTFKKDEFDEKEN